MYANCKYPYWRFHVKYKDIFWDLFMMNEGPRDLEEITIANTNLKNRIKAKRSGKKKPVHLMRYHQRILE